MKACGFRWTINFFSLREKASKEQKLLAQFLKFIVFALFFIRKKRAVKEAEKRAVLSLCQCVEKLERARLSPLVMFARAAQTFGGTARRKNDLRILCKRTVGDACPYKQICKSQKCAVVPSKFYEVRIKFPLGEAKEVWVESRTDQPIKRHVFCLFLQLFLSKRKSL